MSSKRKAEEQLTKDDYERLEANDNDDDNNDNDDSTNSNNNNNGRFSPVQSGYGIQRATAEQMKTRRIIKARRPVADAESTATTTTSADNKKDHTDAVVIRPNAFANVKLTAAAPAAAPSSSGRPVFGASSQYKGFGTTVAAGSGGFSFGGSSGSTSTGGGGGSSGSGFGGFATAAAATATTDGNTTTKPFFGFSKDAATSATATAGANESTAPDAAAAAAPSSSSSVLPDNFVVQSGEEDQVCVLETRSKVFRFGTPTASGPAPTAAAMPTTASTTPTSTSAAAAGAVLSVPPTSTGFRKIEKEIAENKESAEKESPAGGAKLEESKETDDEKVANENDSKMTKVEQLKDNSKKEDSALSEPTKVTAKDIKPAAAAAAADDEEGEERGHEVDDNNKKKREWVEVGIGQLRVLKPRDKPETKFARLVHRRQPDRKEKPTKVLVNCLLGQESKVQAVSDTHIQVSTFSEQNAALMWLFKFRTNGLAEEFRKCVASVTAEAKSFSASMNTTTTTSSSSSSSSPVKNPENGPTETKNALTSPTKQEEDKSPNAVTSQAKEEDNASTTSS